MSYRGFPSLIFGRDASDLSEETRKILRYTEVVAAANSKNVKLFVYNDLVHNISMSTDAQTACSAL